MLESIGNLRNIAYGYAPNIWRQVNMACDEIEQEIAERYIELPVDADGVPIHEGDVIQFVNEQGGTGAKVEVCAISKHYAYYGEDYAYYGEGKHFYKASMCRHVKPRTLEDVLKELANEVWEASCTCQTTWSDSGLDGIEERYADEIREVLGVSE